MGKVILYLLLIPCFLLSVVPVMAKPLVITTTQDLASIASLIGGDAVEVEYLVPGRANTHHVELKPSYALKLVKADAVVRVGLGLDDWIYSLIDNSRNAKLKPGMPAHIDASDSCKLLDVPTGRVDRSMGDVHPYGNPHYLLDTENGLIVAGNLAARFSALFPEGKAAFEVNLKAFETTYTSKKAAWGSLIEKVAGTKVVTYHRMWGYFARFSGIEPVAEIEPKPGIPPTGSHTRDVIEQMKAQEVPIIIRSPFYEDRTPDSIASRTGAVVVTLASQVGALPEANDYWSLFETNLKKLAEVLND